MMANPHRGEVVLKVGEKDYKISFSINALCELEDELNSTINEIAAELQDRTKIRMRTVRALIWAGLLDHNPEFNGGTGLLKAGEIASEIGLPASIAIIGEAFAQAFPDAPPKAEGKGSRPRKAGNG